MLQRENLQSIWEKIVNLGFSEYKKLNRIQRVWFNVESLTTGGLIDHYINFGADNNSDLIEDLEYLGFKDVVNLFLEVNRLFVEGYPPKNIDNRNNEVGNWDEIKNGILEDKDRLFWESSESIEKSLLEHINKNLKEIDC